MRERHNNILKRLAKATSIKGGIDVCQANRRIPSNWKDSNTVLIYKKGDPNSPCNWRPICLQQAIYKIYAAVLAKRLATWCIKHNTISPLQKGFLPFEGCFEHSFVMQSLITDSKRRNKDLRIVWLDLKNAFGSVPHDKLFDMMSCLNIPSHFITLCKDIYSGSSSRIRTKRGYTQPIPQTIGVKQGCPLSPLLFNLAIQGMLIGLDQIDCGYKFSDGRSIKYLAYADDLCIIDSTQDGINAMMQKLEEFSTWAHLTFNHSKCASLSMINRKHDAKPSQAPQAASNRT